MARPKSEMGDIRTSPRGVRLLRFLKRKPTPAKLLGETVDGDEVTCVINGTGSAQFTDAAGVVKHCVKIQALDSKGDVLRVLTLDPDDHELRAEFETENAITSIAKHGSVPIISVDIPRLVDNIARNMRDVAREASQQNASAHAAGFTAMVNVVNIALNLLVGVEQRLANAEDQLATRQAPSEEEEPDERIKMALAALQQAMGGGGKSNGNGGAWDPAKLMGLVQSLQNAQPGGENGDS